MREENTKEYWDNKWALEERNLPENCTLDGSDGEEEFDKELLTRTVGKTVLDLGYGSGAFSLKIAKKAKNVTGVDISTTAFVQARRSLEKSKLTNAEFRLGHANILPFEDNSFDVVYSRRGPGSDSIRELKEAYRVLRKNGAFLEITIGERDKQNLARIFGRGQMLSVKGQVAMKKRGLLEKAGFKKVVARDYLGTEVFKAMSDLLVRLQTAPIIPSFDPIKDRESLRRVEKECMTDRGIETPVHRVVLIGQK
jgi:SAM-dependent methyltransferase